ncbi:MAG: hypothetical protein QXW35_01570 [Candidatus Aenigmatarchaeota archaeon]
MYPLKDGINKISKIDGNAQPAPQEVNRLIVMPDRQEIYLDTGQSIRLV